MILNAEHSVKSRYSGKVLLSVIMLVFVVIALAIFAAYGARFAAASKYDQASAQLAALNAPKAIKEKPKVGVLKAVVFIPPHSSALIDETIVHTGDTIHGVTIVAIQNNSVDFAKDGVTWQQAVLDAPHPAWTNTPKDASHPAK